jgi:hypothetical protein
MSDGRIFPNYHSGAGGNASPRDEGYGVIASLNADVTLELRFHMPPTIPTGTMKMRILALANATSGAAKVTVKDQVATPAASPSASGNPSAVSLTSETQSTVTWTTSENDRYKETKVPLSTSAAGNDVMVVAILFSTSGWTLAQVSTWIFSIIWE